MKILFIIPWVPYPLDSGGNQAFFNMLDCLRKKHDITLISYTHRTEEKKNASELQKIWNNIKIECYTDKQSLRPSLPEFSKKDKRKYSFYEFLRRSMQRKEARLIKKYNSKVITQSVSKEDQELSDFVRQNSTLFKSSSDINSGFLQYIHKKSREGFDMVQVEFYEYLPLIYVLPENVRKVFVHHELRFIRNENELSLFQNRTIDDEVLFKKEKDRELAMLSHFDDIIVLTETDKNILHRYLPNTNIYTSPALTNANKTISNLSFRECRDLVFLGGGNHFPNADGILWFTQRVWPILKRRGFNDNIYVVGKWEKDIKQLINSKCSSVQFTGFIEDVHSFINGKITIVPIRIGSGMRMKILDAMAAVSPIVTTSKGCEGLPLTNGSDCFIADKEEEFCNCIMNLKSDIQLQKQMVSNCSNKLHTILDSQQLIETRLSFYQ